MKIEDYYGRKLEAEPVGASPGPMVDLNVELPAGRDFFRLTLEDALKLAEQLTIAAGHEREDTPFRQLLSAAKQWRHATEARVKLIAGGTGRHVEDVTLHPDQAFIATLNRIEREVER